MLRTAIVGLGTVAGLHEVAIGNTPEAELVAVADIDASAVDRATARTGATGYAGLDALLREEPVDWVHVCTPVGTHFDLAMECIDREVHVLVEKPFVRSRREFERLVAAADRAGVRATPVHNQAYYPAFRDACRRIERGEFGEGIVHPIYVGLRAAGYPADESAVSVSRVETTGDGAVDFDGITLSYTTADDVACTIQHHSNVPDRRRIDFAAEAGHLTVDIATGSGRVERDSYSPNSPFGAPRVRASLAEARSAVRVAVRAVVDAVGQRVLPTRHPHDTHSPVVRREAAAIRGHGDGATPRAEAEWATRLFERLGDT